MDIRSALTHSIVDRGVKLPTLLDILNESSNAAISGWVSVIPMGVRDRTPRMFGIVVPGVDQATQQLRSRLLIAANQCQAWFMDELLHASDTKSEIQFEVRVVRRHPNGVTAFVTPLAQSRQELYAKWEERKMELMNLPLSAGECRGLKEFREYFYRKIGSYRGWRFYKEPESDDVRAWVIAEIDHARDQALALTYNSHILRLTGADRAYRFRDDLIQGRKRFKDVVTECVRIERVHRL